MGLDGLLKVSKADEHVSQGRPGFLGIRYTGVYGILQLKYGYSVYHFPLNFRYKVYLGIILVIFG